jgi:hypothetical protein
MNDEKDKRKTFELRLNYVVILCIYNIDKSSHSIFFYSMDKLKDKVLFLIGCMLLFQIIDFFFKLPFPSSLDMNFNNLYPIVETNIELLLTYSCSPSFTIAKLSSSSIIKIRALGEAEEQHMVFLVSTNRI